MSNGLKFTLCQKSKKEMNLFDFSLFFASLLSGMEQVLEKERQVSMKERKHRRTYLDNMLIYQQIGNVSGDIARCNNTKEKSQSRRLIRPVVRMTEIILYRKGDCRLNDKTETRYKTEIK